MRIATTERAYRHMTVILFPIYVKTLNGVWAAEPIVLAAGPIVRAAGPIARAARLTVRAAG